MREIQRVQRGRRGGLLGDFFLLRQNEADAGGEQDEREDVTDPCEALEQAEAGGDEGSAEDDGAENSPEEDAGLKGFGNLEDAEEQQEDEEIVDRERFLNGIAGEELGGGGVAERAKEEEREGEGGDGPHDGGRDGVGALAAGAGFADAARKPPAREEKLCRKEKQEREVKAEPVAERSLHAFRRFYKGERG